MRFKSFVLGSASMVVLALASAPAAAQSDPVTPNDPSVQAQE